MQPVTITEKALIEIKNILRNKNIPAEYGLRVGVKGGGCGVSFVLGFDKEKDGDLTYEVDGVPVYVQKRETMFLVGKEIDWHEGKDEMGFVFNTPES